MYVVPSDRHACRVYLPEQQLMPVRYSCHSGSHFLHTVFSGVVTDEDLKQQADAVASDPEIQPPIRELVDLAGVTEDKISPESLRYIAAVDARNPGRFKGQKTAVVAPTDLLFGRACIFLSFSDSAKTPAVVRVFRSENEARAWLSVAENSGMK
jgi:hypothetical protein